VPKAAPLFDPELFGPTLTLFRNFVQLPLWLVRKSEQGMQWRELNEFTLLRRPTVYEAHFDKPRLWLDRVVQGFDLCRAQGRPLVDDCVGFHALFVPLELPGAGGPAILYAADFLQRQPDWPSLASQWFQLSGQKSRGFDGPAIGFTRMALGLPVLNPRVLALHKDALTLMAGLLDGSLARGRALREAERLRLAMGAEGPTRAWVRQLLGEPELQPRDAAATLRDWEVQESGLLSLPNTVLALFPRESAYRGLSPCERMVKTRWFASRCHELAREKTDCLAFPQGGEGMLILASMPAGAKGIKAAAAWARDWELMVQQRLGMSCASGVSRPVEPSLTLAAARSEAVLAASGVLAGASGQRAVAGATGALGLAAIERDLIEDLRLKRTVRAKAGLETFLEPLTRSLNYNMEGTRAALERFMAAACLGAEGGAELWVQCGPALRVAESLDEMLRICREAIDALLRAAPHAGSGQGLAGFDALNQWVQGGGQGTGSIPSLARNLGMSEPSLRRLFRDHLGGTPAKTRQRARLDRAKGLLLETSLSVEDVAQECGFHSSRSFRRAFCRCFRCPPAAYRRGVSGQKA
jgi:AraC-like DNA-binding protein